jgi:cytidylate kinase
MESEREITSRISERQMRLWNALHSAGRLKSNPHNFITISRDEGTLGSRIAQGLANKLGWRVYDKEIVNEIANNSHVREELVRRLDEKYQNLAYQAIISGILDMFRMPESTNFGSEAYHESLLKTLAALAAHGDAVLIGRGANFALRLSKHGIHVRIVGSFEMRLKRIIETCPMKLEDARRHLQETDSERRAFIRYHYKHDYDDVRFYHAVFNTDHLAVDQVVDSIYSLVNSERIDPELKSDLRILNG